MASAVSVGRASGLWHVYRRARNLRIPWIPVIIMTILLVCAAFAPLLAPYDPTLISMLDAKVAPGEDWSHPLGTDVMGRDMLSRLIFGARTSVIISLIAMGTGVLVGTLLGLMSGYQGGWLDIIVMRAADAFMGFPTILVAMIIVVFLGTGMENIILAVALTTWARFARMIRGEVLALKELDFITMAKIAGVTTPVIIGRHVLPNTVNTLMVLDQPPGRTDHFVGSLPQLPRAGVASRAPGLGDYGFGGAHRDPRNMVAGAFSRSGYHCGSSGVQLLWGLAAGHYGPKVAAGLNSVKRRVYWNSRLSSKSVT